VPFVTLDKKYIGLKLPMKSGPFFGHVMTYQVQVQAYAASAALKHADPVTPQLCQVWYGSDDQCDLPADAPIHTTSPQRHDFTVVDFSL
jgi:hypothetical protein